MSRIHNSEFASRKSQFALDGRYIQDHFPGIGRYTYNLIEALARIAPDETFVVLHNPALTNTRYDLAALARYPNIELRRVDIATFSLAEQYRFFAIRNALRQFALFHSPYYIKPYLARVPSVVTIFDLIPLVVPDAMPNTMARWMFRLLAGLATRTSDRVITSSASTRDDLMLKLKVPHDKVTVIPLAADACFAPQSNAEIARVKEKYSLPTQYILSVGINKPHKNLATLIRAIRISQLAVPLVIAGAWDERYPPANAPQSAVTFIRNIDNADLPALYAGATVFVAPSLYEGFGLTPLEAMACGAPIVCSNASSLPEVVGGAALLFDPHDADALAVLLTRVLADSALRDELCGKSLARATQFSWERTARETLAVYHSLSN